MSCVNQISHPPLLHYSFEKFVQFEMADEGLRAKLVLL